MKDEIYSRKEHVQNYVHRSLKFVYKSKFYKDEVSAPNMKVQSTYWLSRKAVSHLGVVHGIVATYGLIWISKQVMKQTILRTIIRKKDSQPQNIICCVYFHSSKSIYFIKWNWKLRKSLNALCYINIEHARK